MNYTEVLMGTCSLNEGIRAKDYMVLYTSFVAARTNMVGENRMFEERDDWGLADPASSACFGKIVRSLGGG
jgi:hypothetical protein